jgi:hypothetical protein
MFHEIGRKLNRSNCKWTKCAKYIDNQIRPVNHDTPHHQKTGEISHIKSFWGMPKGVTTGKEMMSGDIDLWHENHTWVRRCRVKFSAICIIQTKNLINKNR